MAGDSLLRGYLAESGLQYFLDDPQYTEIAVNRPFEIWTESSQGWQKHPAPRLDLALSARIANTFGNFNGFEIKPQNPICSGVMPMDSVDKLLCHLPVNEIQSLSQFADQVIQGLRLMTMRHQVGWKNG